MIIRNLSGFAFGCMVLSLATAELAVADDILGIASCDRGVRDRADAPSACRIAWDFASDPRGYYWTQWLDVNDDHDIWRTLDGPMMEPVGRSDGLVEGGKLIRVIGCNDAHGKIDCLSSTVFWAPVLPASVDEIPAVVTTGDGDYDRAYALPDNLQIVVHNAHLMRKLVSAIDMTSMPPMTKLPFEDLRKLPAGVSVADATIDANVEMAYRTRF